MRKTVEAKDIEQLSFLGRNPIGVAGAEGRRHRRQLQHAGGFDDLGNGGFNINGSRADENNITSTARSPIRTRSAGTIIGIQNVDAIQEVQVLTANYMPEYGRASGGQIRFVTKSGSNRYTRQRLVLLPRRVAAGQHLGAQPQHRSRRRTAARRRSTTSSTATPSAARSRSACSRTSCSSSARRSGSTSSRSRPTRSRCRREAMRRGDFSELLNPANGFFSPAHDHQRSADRPAVPGQHHPAEPAVAERHGDAGRSIRCRRRASGRAPTTRSSAATTRRISARTTSASTTG